MLDPDTSYETTLRQDYRINRIFFLAGHYPVDPVDPVKKINRPFDTEAHDGQNTLIRSSMLDVRCSMFISFFFE